MRRTRAASAVLIEHLIDGANHVGHLHVDSEGRILERNARAREFLKSGRGVRERRGRLTAASPEDAEALERLLADASQGAGRTSVAFGTPEGRRVVVHLAPVVDGAAHDCGVDGQRAAACVLLVDPWGEISLNPETLVDALGLTRAQSRVVADLVRGMTTREIAEATARTHGAVRWHVKRALERTEVRRQSDLVRLAVAATSLRLVDREADTSSRPCPFG